MYGGRSLFPTATASTLLGNHAASLAQALYLLYLLCLLYLLYWRTGSSGMLMLMLR